MPANGEKLNRPKRTQLINDMYVGSRPNPRPRSDQPNRPSHVTANPGTPAQKIIPPTPPKEKKQVPHKRPTPSQDMERPSAAFILGFILVLILIGAGTAVAYYFVKYKPAHKPVTASTNKLAPDNTNHIADDTHGIKFAITKDLTAVPNADLAKQNPAFLYGFKQKDVPNVECIISQQPRTPPGGPVSPTSLRDGTLKSIKGAFPDAKLIDYKDITLANGQDAASMTISYTDKNVDIKDRVIVAATTNNVTFAFCNSPLPLFSFYDSKFEPFFNSLEIY